MNNFSIGNPQESAHLKVVGTRSETFRESITCHYLEFRGRLLCLESSMMISAGTSVSVQYEDALYLGEVRRSTEANGEWIVEIGVEQILSGLTSLVALRKSLLCESPVNAMAGTLAGATR